MKMTKNSVTDWRHLSFVEAASAIEVFEVAQHSLITPSVQRRILDHVVEEYQHADIFRTIANYTGQVEYTGNFAKKLIEAGGLSQDKSNNKLVFYKKLAIIQLGELRAIKALKALQTKHHDETIRLFLTQIEKDERRHAASVSHHNRRYKLPVLPHLLHYTIRFSMQEMSQKAHVSRIFDRLTRIFFRALSRTPLQKIAFLPAPVGNRRAAIENSRTSV